MSSVIANMLQANPPLTSAQIEQILQQIGARAGDRLGRRPDQPVKCRAWALTALLAWNPRRPDLLESACALLP